jgi:hypothetical protein
MPWRLNRSPRPDPRDLTRVDLMRDLTRVDLMGGVRR